MDSSLLDITYAIAKGESIEGAHLKWKNKSAVTTVLAALGYPDSPRKGDDVRIPAPPNGVTVFHAGTARDRETDALITNGGRVFAITGVANTIEEAAKLSRDFSERVSFDGKQFRRDIARRELERNARAS